MELRNTGVELLAKYFEGNNETIEQLIWDNAQCKSEIYRQNLLQIIYDLDTGKSERDVEAKIKMNQLGWNHPVFEDAASAYQEQNDFIEHPFEVVEGIQTCRKCGSSRVFSYNKQCRSGDEGTSVFCECTNCHSKWQESG